MAGGIAAVGSDSVILTGNRGGKPYRRVIDVSGIYLNDKPGDDAGVSAGDTIYVHRAPVFYIYGEIQRPGSYRVERGMTIVQGVAQGGGLTPRGTERGLKLQRRDAAGKVQEISPAMTDLIQADDVIYVRESIL